MPHKPKPFTITATERESIAKTAKAAAQSDDPILPTRAEAESRESFIENGGWAFPTMKLLAVHYAKRLDRCDNLPVLPSPPPDEAPLGLILQVEELLKGAGWQVGPCKECATWEKRRDNAEKAAAAWKFASEENLKCRQQEKQKNETLLADLEELRGHLVDIINQAERDDGVAVEEPADRVCKAPWSGAYESIKLAVDENGVLHRAGYVPMVHVRVLAEANYQYARHCVNVHDELLAACQEAKTYIINDRIRDILRDAVEKAEATP